jgi:hypothetical protein
MLVVLATLASYALRFTILITPRQPKKSKIPDIGERGD